MAQETLLSNKRRYLTHLFVVIPKTRPLCVPRGRPTAGLAAHPMDPGCDMFPANCQAAAKQARLPWAARRDAVSA